KYSTSRAAGMGGEYALIVVQSAAGSRQRRGSVDLHQGAAVDRQCDPGNEIRLIGGQEQGRVGDVPGGPHLVARRRARVTPGGNLGTALAAGAGTGVNRHGGIYQPRQDDVGAYPE